VDEHENEHEHENCEKYPSILHHTAPFPPSAPYSRSESAFILSHPTGILVHAHHLCSAAPSVPTAPLLRIRFPGRSNSCHRTSLNAGQLRHHTHSITVALSFRTSCRHPQPTYAPIPARRLEGSIWHPLSGAQSQVSQHCATMTTLKPQLVRAGKKRDRHYWLLLPLLEDVN
jgi:hypothetical protein